jgi:flagellar motor protein MotB
MKALLNAGVAFSSVTARGWADTRPVADSDEEGGRARNRRVELRFITPGR